MVKRAGLKILWLSAFGGSNPPPRIMTEMTNLPIIDPEKLYGTGYVANLCGVSRALVIKWIDEYEALPCRRNRAKREITGESLLHFLAENEIYHMVGGTTYTTGEVAQEFGVTPRTVASWEDSGIIEAYRIPFYQDRRFTESSVNEFSIEYGLEEYRGDEFYSTGEVAQMLSVDRRTIANWINSEDLIGISIPGSNHRRIPKRELEQFIIAHNMEDLNGERTYRTGEIAKALGVSDSAINNWIDTGNLVGHRLPKGERRITETRFLKLLEARGNNQTQSPSKPLNTVNI